MENIILYILIFCIGTVFGSFFTLAVYRLPLHQDITHKRSYCPNCNHKLSFFDMIPVLSYIFLGGKCRYCKEKIRPRYLCLEILTGITFLLFAMSVNLDLHIINTSKFVYLVFGILYMAGLIIIAGIDKEKYKIQKSLIIYETVVVCTYIIYLYTVEHANIYRYVIYLFAFLIFVLSENAYYNKKLKDYYPLEILQLSMIMAMFQHEFIFIFTVILTLLAISIKCIIKHLNQRSNKVVKTEKKYYLNLPMGYYLCCSNIIVMIIINFIAFRGGNLI